MSGSRRKQDGAGGNMELWCWPHTAWPAPKLGLEAGGGTLFYGLSPLGLKWSFNPAFLSHWMQPAWERADPKGADSSMLSADLTLHS